MDINKLLNFSTFNFIVFTKKIMNKIIKIDDKLMKFNNNIEKYKILKKKKIMLLIYLLEYICENNIILFIPSMNKLNAVLKIKSDEMKNDLLLNYIDINGDIYNNLFIDIDMNNIYELKKKYPYEYLYYLIEKWIYITQIGNTINDNFIEINNILLKISKPENPKINIINEKNKNQKKINIINETNLRRSDRLKKLRGNNLP